VFERSENGGGVLTPRAQPLQLHTVPPEDSVVYDAICKADTIGVFQIESRAQMSMLPRLRPRTFYDLVIEVAIVRPGPIQGKMVHPYLRRRNKEETFTYPNDAVEKVLGKTLGVPLFQEQAMSLAIVAAGFTPGEADQLRRAMAAWKRKGNLIYRFGEKLIAGMLARGYPQEFADNCFEQIKGFSEYGFPESHAASFALLVYVSAWQKVHHPAAFAAALINSQPMGFYAPAQIVRDAQEHGVEVRPVDVNISNWDCTLEFPKWQSGEVAKWQSEEKKSGLGALCHSATSPLSHSPPALRLGVRLIDGLRQSDASLLLASRKLHGPSKSIERLWRTSNIPVRALRRLAAADAFGSMNLSRQDALWHIRRMRDEHLPLFDGQFATSHDEPIPTLPAIPAARTLRHDYDAIGLSLKGHPLALDRDRLTKLGILTALQLRDPIACPHGKKVAVAGLVLVRQRPGTAAGIVFMTIEDESAAANLILFPKVFHKYRRAARHSVAVAAWGTIERAGEVVHVKVRAIADLADAADFTTLNRPVSRDFR
jgi:error-prone DNA polymerase